MPNNSILYYLLMLTILNQIFTVGLRLPINAIISTAITSTIIKMTFIMKSILHI